MKYLTAVLALIAGILTLINSANMQWYVGIFLVLEGLIVLFGQQK